MEIPADNEMRKKTPRVINKSMLQGVAAQLNVAGGALKSLVKKKIIMVIIKILEQIPLLPAATER